MLYLNTVMEYRIHTNSDGIYNYILIAYIYIFVFKEFGEENKEETDSTSVAVSEGPVEKQGAETKEEPSEDA